MINKEEIRLQKYLSSCGVASRRGAEELITSGRVKINGVIADKLGVKVTKDDIVSFDDKIINAVQKRYIVLNKPEGYLCTRKDPHGTHFVFDLLGESDDPSLFHVGRLDMDSCGLLIITNDGDFANNLIHPSTSVKKGYIVEADEEINQKLIRDFSNGIEIGGVRYKALSCEVLDDERFALIQLKEGKKREIREVFKYFLYRIIKLERIFIGNMKLSELGLKPGEYKSFTKEEIENIIYKES